MSQETHVLASYYFPTSRAFTDERDLERKISECKESIKMYWNRLHQLVFMTEPKKFCEDDMDPAWWLQNQMDEIQEELEAEIWWLSRYEAVQANIKKCFHENGGAKVGPEEFDDAVRIKGDYIVEVGEDGEPVGLDMDDSYDRQVVENFHNSYGYKQWKEAQKKDGH